jgi:hypothetical protein
MAQRLNVLIGLRRPRSKLWNDTRKFRTKVRYPFRAVKRHQGMGRKEWGSNRLKGRAVATEVFYMLERRGAPGLSWRFKPCASL